MPVYKDEERNTWFVKFKYKEPDGKIKYVTKRGFALKREAVVWENEHNISSRENAEMTFGALVEIYKREHLTRLRESTAAIKSNMIDNLIAPYFKDYIVSEISEKDIFLWQNSLLNPAKGKKKYSQSYLRTVHSVLNAILNYAVAHYGLKENLAAKAGSIGSLKRIRDEYWTLEEYSSFISKLEAGSRLHLAFELLYWTGLREGELLALTPADYNEADRVLDINKSYCVSDGEKYIFPPKTEEGCRRIKLPEFLCRELSAYISTNHIGKDDRIINSSKHLLSAALKKNVENTDLPRIKIHEFRHSHASLLISMGFNTVAVASRLGHKSSYVTLRYTHADRDAQKHMVQKLNSAV